MNLQLLSTHMKETNHGSRAVTLDPRNKIATWMLSFINSKRVKPNHLVVGKKLLERFT